MKLDENHECESGVCSACDVFGTELWRCTKCGRCFHANCSGADDEFPYLCDECANEEYSEVW